MFGSTHRSRTGASVFALLALVACSSPGPEDSSSSQNSAPDLSSSAEDPSDSQSVPDSEEPASPPVTTPELTAPEEPVAEVDRWQWLPDGLDRLSTWTPARDPAALARVELGHRLFFDPALSHDNSTSCASCHDPRRGLADARPLPETEYARVHTASLWNVGHHEVFGWDGLTDDLADYVFEHLFAPSASGVNDDGRTLQALDRSAEYRKLFDAAFGVPPTLGGAADALADYLHTFVATDSPFDRWVAGEKDALDEQQKQGLALFAGKAGCIECHHGPNFSDGEFHDLGVAAGGTEDHGRYDVSGRESDLGSFRTPSLREVARTAPYLHDGSLATLEEVVEFHAQGGNFELGSELEPVDLTSQEVSALVAFLRSLSGEQPAVAPPAPAVER